VSNLSWHLGMRQIPDGWYLRYRLLTVPAGITGADSDIPQTAAVDRSWPAATQAASLCTYISA